MLYAAISTVSKRNSSASRGNSAISFCAMASFTCICQSASLLIVCLITRRFRCAIALLLTLVHASRGASTHSPFHIHRELGRISVRSWVTMAACSCGSRARARPKSRNGCCCCVPRRSDHPSQQTPVWRHPPLPRSYNQAPVCPTWLRLAIPQLAVALEAVAPAYTACKTSATRLAHRVVGARRRLHGLAHLQCFNFSRGHLRRCRRRGPQLTLLCPRPLRPLR